MTADKAVKRKTNCKNSSFWYFMSALEIISAEVFNISIFAIELISAQARKISAVAFARCKRGQIGAFRKKLLEHFTAIFGFLNDIFYEK